MSFQKSIGLAIVGCTLLVGAPAFATVDMCAQDSNTDQWSCNSDYSDCYFDYPCANLYGEQIGDVEVLCNPSNTCFLKGHLYDTPHEPGTKLTAFAFDIQGNEVGGIGVGACEGAPRTCDSGTFLVPASWTLYVTFND